MRKTWIPVVAAILIGTVPAMAKVDKGDVAAFILGMAVQEVKNDKDNERTVKEAQAAQVQQTEQKQTVKRGELKKLLAVNRKIVDEVFEESDESVDFVLDIYEGNNKKLAATATEIKPFVFDYFEDEFGEDAVKMYKLWSETKFKDWLEANYE